MRENGVARAVAMIERRWSHLYALSLFRANYEKNDLLGFVFISHMKTSTAKRMALEMSSFAVSQSNNVAMRQCAMITPTEYNERFRNLIY